MDSSESTTETVVNIENKEDTKENPLISGKFYIYIFEHLSMQTNGLCKSKFNKFNFISASDKAINGLNEKLDPVHILYQVNGESIKIELEEEDLVLHTLPIVKTEDEEVDIKENLSEDPLNSGEAEYNIHFYK